MTSGGINDSLLSLSLLLCVYESACRLEASYPKRGCVHYSALECGAIQPDLGQAAQTGDLH